ncbi:putative GNAT family N-acetyltransferase [Phlyctema vagabunda]|uniref:GNAT family N-acetyltransferase n=1 Tax=Phlyctema vagabunda TaxID=108571 RepID=A0ABR4PHZ8_9HELO
MTSRRSSLQQNSWTRDGYYISTKPSDIPIEKLNAYFASDLLYWAKPLSEAAMRETLESSIPFGLYAMDSSTRNGEDTTNLIGFARCVTDFTTILYLTDVFVDPAYQGKGLGSWLIGCVGDVIEPMPDLRASLLFTGDWQRTVPFYEKLLGMHVMESRRGEDGQSGEGLALMERLGRGDPDFEKQITRG